MANNVPGSSQSPNYYNNPPSNAWMVNLTDSVGLVLVTLAVFARCYTKFSIIKAPGWEDYICIAAYAIYVTFVALHFVHHLHYGGGRHTIDIPPEYLYDFFWTKVVANYLYIIGCTLAKFSLLLFLYRIFSVSFRFRLASWALGAVLAIWTSVTMLLCIFACRPIVASWVVRIYLAPSTHCPIKVPNVTTIHGFCNVLTDFALLFLPVPMVWNLHVTTKKKVGLAAVFATGVFICAVSIVRQHILYNTNKVGDNYYTKQVMVWMDIEFSFSIIVATLPVLTPLFKRLSVLSVWLPALRSKITRSKRSTPSNSKYSKNSGPDRYQDIERNPLSSDQHPPNLWRTPSAWKETGGERNWDNYHNDGGTVATTESDVTLQDLSPDGRERKEEQTLGSEDFVQGLDTRRT
ncbi:MAG: hypothetical protein Q9184_002634 [Pyrenodesmia sp. 2 TL-2023]